MIPKNLADAFNSLLPFPDDVEAPEDLPPNFREFTLPIEKPKKSKKSKNWL